jgi:hypothetical protein
MVYPYVCFGSTIASHLAQRETGEAAAYEMYPQVYSCGHLLHGKCIGQADDSCCPRCKNRHNGGLPRVSDDLREFRNPAARDHWLGAWQEVKSHSRGYHLVRILANHILLTEVRFRRKPEVLEAEETAALLRALFALGLFVGSSVQYPEAPVTRMTDLEMVVWNAFCEIMKGFPQNTGRIGVPEFIDIVRTSLSGEISTAPVLIGVLRQATIFAHFMMKIPIAGENPLIDWDLILSPMHLFGLYHLGVEMCPDFDANLPPPLDTAPLPDDWISLVEPPYSLNIGDQSVPLAMDLITGNLMATGMNRNGTDLLPTHDYVAQQWNLGAVPIIFLTGPHSTQTAVVSIEYNDYISALPIYVDSRGLPDIGYERGQLLSLNRQNLESLFDDFLCGRFAGRFHP